MVPLLVSLLVFLLLYTPEMLVLLLVCSPEVLLRRVPFIPVQMLVPLLVFLLVLLLCRVPSIPIQYLNLRWHKMHCTPEIVHARLKRSKVDRKVVRGSMWLKQP
ncbi:hypothetical protein BT93_L3594 [Corymbia citriodora subsp. variegata]|uniref:Uncharacterized protein n=1 Tax=Corymbia citriodora subsp. variegata TaxID=360336 RepID=A0A8T0CI49_CORYI|nr:hypothetical protein BT93_L3594 [Corymbia citriodora subsp. variegata]